MELVVKNISKSFFDTDGSISFQLSINELRFEFGKVHYLMGHNGSGKSVLVKLLTGEYDNDGLLNIKPKNSKFACIRQDAEKSLSPSLTIYENLLLKKNIIKSNYFPKLMDIYELNNLFLNFDNILPYKEQFVSELSGGQKQFLAYLSVRYQKPQVLLLDEFLSAVDRKTKEYLRKDISSYVIDNSAIAIIVSHDVELAINDADVIHILNKGKLKRVIMKNQSDWERNTVSALI